MAGEVFLGRKLVQVFANEIEWTYPSVEKTNNNDEKKSPRKALKSKHLDFEEQFMSSNSKGKTTNHIRESGKKRRSADHDPQEESSTARATKLTHTMNEVVSNNKGCTDAVENLYNIENDDDNNKNETVVNDNNGDESCDTE